MSWPWKPKALPEISTNSQGLKLTQTSGLQWPCTLSLCCPHSQGRKLSPPNSTKNTLPQVALRFSISDYKWNTEQRCTTLIPQKTNLIYKVHIYFLMEMVQKFPSDLFPQVRSSLTFSQILPSPFSFSPLLSRSQFNHFFLCLIYLQHDVLESSNIYSNLLRGDRGSSLSNCSSGASRSRARSMGKNKWGMRGSLCC